MILLNDNRIFIFEWTHPHVIPNLYDFHYFSLRNIKKYISAFVSTVFVRLEVKMTYNIQLNGPPQKNLNIIFCVPQKKVIQICDFAVNFI